MRHRSESTIRIVPWNLGHQTCLADIRPRFFDAASNPLDCQNRSNLV
jgi:hypothetical protein